MTATTTLARPSRPTTAEGWYADPRSRHHLRYHDGERWTDHVTHFGPVPCRGCAPLDGDGLDDPDRTVRLPRLG